MPDADIVISQPFCPAYLTAQRIANAPQLKLAITAGIGSDHVNLQAAIERGMTVAEVTYCNSISVSERGRDGGRHGGRRTHRHRRSCTGLKPSTSSCTTPDRHRLSAGVQQELNATFHPSAESLVRVCDVVTINTPLPTDAIVEGLEVASGGTYDLLNGLVRSNGDLRPIVDEATRVVPVLREGETSLVAS
jgi:formate dehydrogenase